MENEISFKSHKISNNDDIIAGCEVITKVDNSPLNGDKFDDVMLPTRYYLNNHEHSQDLPVHADWFMKGVPQDEFSLKHAEDYLYNCIHNNSADIDMTFLGFLETYKALADIIPLKYKVLDLGCSYGFQSVFFKNHEFYRGLDIVDNKRHWFYNKTGFHQGDIRTEDFTKYNNEERFVIVNAVTTDDETLKRVKDHFKYLYICYPK